MSQRNRMQVVVLASQKGGSGKTTLAVHLAVEAARTMRVMLIDTDPQGTLTTWWRARDAETPGMAQLQPDLARQLDQLRATGMELVIIDTPPAITAAIAAVVAVADLVLLPVRASPADLWAVGATVALCQAAGRPFAFVLCDATRNALATAEAALALSEHGVVAPAILYRRQGYSRALGSGHAAQELPAAAVGNEVATLLQFVLKRLFPAVTATRTKARRR